MCKREWKDSKKLILRKDALPLWLWLFKQSEKDAFEKAMKMLKSMDVKINALLTGITAREKFWGCLERRLLFTLFQSEILPKLDLSVEGYREDRWGSIQVSQEVFQESKWRGFSADKRLIRQRGETGGKWLCLPSRVLAQCVCCEGGKVILSPWWEILNIFSLKKLWWENADKSGFKRQIIHPKED